MYENIFDVIIVGGGPAGLTAGLYCARGKLNTLMFEKSTLGGQIAITDLVENYPGFPEGISGKELTKKFRVQAERFGLKIEKGDVINIKLEEDNIKKVILKDNREFLCKALILTPGANPRKLNVPGEDEFLNRGVSYCATCDGALYEGCDIAVIGGGDSAAQESVFLTHFGKTVYLIHRRDKLRAKPLLQDRVFSNPKIKFIPNKVVKRIVGEEVVNKIILEDTITKEQSELFAEGVFIFIGMEPSTYMVKDLGILDEFGYIITDEKMETSIPGIFAAGDCRQSSTGQVAVAVGEGCIAAMSAEKFINLTV